MTNSTPARRKSRPNSFVGTVDAIIDLFEERVGNSTVLIVLGPAWWGAFLLGLKASGIAPPGCVTKMQYRGAEIVLEAESPEFEIWARVCEGE